VTTTTVTTTASPTAATRTPTVSLVDEVNQLHAAYVVAINQAVADGEFDRANELAENYDKDAVELIAEREGKTHLLPIRRRPQPDTALRRLVAHLTGRSA
jgi:hypothetical protein